MALAVVIAVLPITRSAALFAAIALGLGILLEPGLGIIVLALALPFGSLVSLPGLPANIVDLLVALVVGAWALKGLAARQPEHRRSASGLAAVGIHLGRSFEFDAGAVVARGRAGVAQVGRSCGDLHRRRAGAQPQTNLVDGRGAPDGRRVGSDPGRVPVLAASWAGRLHPDGPLHAGVRHVSPTQPVCRLPGLSDPRGRQPGDHGAWRRDTATEVALGCRPARRAARRL